MPEEPKARTSLALRIEFGLLLAAWILSLVWMITGLADWLD